MEAVDTFTCRSAEDGSLQTWIHADPNLGVIAFPPNLAKGRQPASTLAAVCTTVTDSENASPNQKATLVQTLIDRLTEQRFIALRYAVTRKTRMNRSFTKEEFDIANAEFRTGRFKYRSWSEPCNSRQESVLYVHGIAVSELCLERREDGWYHLSLRRHRNRERCHNSKICY